MKVMSVKNPGGIANLVLEDRPAPEAGPGEVLVRVHATSLNYHDLMVVLGALPTEDGRIPMSDGAGEIVAVGEGVTGWNVGDKVLSTFFPNWRDGAPHLDKMLGVPGDHADGWAAELVAAPAHTLTRMPKGYSYAEAATLPCAALTAWRGLVVEGKMKPGQWVLTQGTGGVSIFALQMAKAAGAKVIATSSSDDKLARLKEMGADHTINYKEIPDWGLKAKELTGGIGVDEVVEIGGAGTMAQSIRACRIGGHISLIGVLTGMAGEVPTAEMFSANITVSGITVGARQHQEDMVAALETTGIKPVIDRSFPLEELGTAFEHQSSGAHFGKIVVEW